MYDLIENATTAGPRRLRRVSVRHPPARIYARLAIAISTTRTHSARPRLRQAQQRPAGRRVLQSSPPPSTLPSIWPTQSRRLYLTYRVVCSATTFINEIMGPQLSAGTWCNPLMASLGPDTWQVGFIWHHKLTNERSNETFFFHQCNRFNQ